MDVCLVHRKEGENLTDKVSLKVTLKVLFSLSYWMNKVEALIFPLFGAPHMYLYVECKTSWARLFFCNIVAAP